MSMKLDEYSFNLKEEEIKGGFNFKLPNGVVEVKDDDKENVVNNINDITGSNLIKTDINTLLQIKRTTYKQPNRTETFNKFSELFDEEKGKSLHFLKASFFKTDKNTIYTHSEHRIPTQLVEDFSEYYANEFERNIVSGVNSKLQEDDFKQSIKAFVTLINIIYLLCKKIEDYLGGEVQREIKALNKKELNIVTDIIRLLDEPINGSQSLKEIFITEIYAGDNSDLKDINDGAKIDDEAIFDIKSLSKTKNISLKFIINKLYVLHNYLNKIIIAGSAINIFKPDLYNERSGKNLNYNNYLYLYNAIRKNLKNLKEQPQTETEFNKIKPIKDKSDKSDIGDNLNVLTEIIIEVLNKFNVKITELYMALPDILNNNALIIDTVLQDLQSKIEKVKTDNQYKSIDDINEDVNTKIQKLKDSATSDVESEEVRKRDAEMVKGFKREMEKLESDFKTEFKKVEASYNDNLEEYKTQTTKIESIINSAQELSDGSAIITEEQYIAKTEELESLTTKINDNEVLLGQVNAYATQADMLIDETTVEFNKLNTRLTGHGESAAENFVASKERLAQITDAIADYKTAQSTLIASIKDNYTARRSKESLIVAIEKLLKENDDTQEGFKQDHDSKAAEITDVVNNINNNIKKINEILSDDENTDFTTVKKLVEELKTNITNYNEFIKEAKNIFNNAKKANDKATVELVPLNKQLNTNYGDVEKTINPFSISDINKNTKYRKDLTNIIQRLETKEAEYAQKIIEQQETAKKTKLVTLAQARVKGYLARKKAAILKEEQKQIPGLGGGNNTKELRQKLNTMSIKQLKRLSDKKHIEYGNKNTIKSLINNYMKHI